jgi:hypothetical protein
MKKIIAILAFLLFFLFPDYSIAVGVVVVSNFPSAVASGQEFEISFEASGLEANRNYNIKGLGGENFTEVDTCNGDWFQQNAAWASMPVFGSGLEGSPSGTLKVRFDGNTQSGVKDFKIRIKKSDSTDSNIDSEVVMVFVAAIPRTPTPAAVSTPASITTPTSTSIATKIPIPTPLNSTLSRQPTPTPEEVKTEILGVGVSNLNPISTPTPESLERNNIWGKFPAIAIGLILLGLIFIGASSYVYFKRNNKVTHEETLI